MNARKLALAALAALCTMTGALVVSAASARQRKFGRGREGGSLMRARKLTLGLVPLLCMMVGVLALAGLASSADADVVHTLESEITGVGAPAWGYNTGVAVDDSALGISSGDVYVAESIGFLPSAGAVDKFKRELGAWQYVCQITGAGSASTSASECNTSAAGPGAFTGPGFSPPIYQPAVSSSGDVYVPAYASNAVDEFSPDGEYLGQITGAAEPRSVAIASSGKIYIASNAEGILYQYNPTSKTLVELIKALGAGSLRGVAVDNDATSPSYGDVYIVNSDANAVEKYSATGEKKATIAPPSGSFSSPSGVAVDQSNGHLYVADAGAEMVDEFNAEGDFLGKITGTETKAGSLAAQSVAAGPAGEVDVDTGEVIDVFSPGQVTATPTTGAASKVGVSGATLEGTVNPEGTTVASCSFEYGTSASAYEHSVPCKQASGEIGNGDSPVPVSAEVTGLEADTEYDFRLVTKSATGPSVDGGNAVFTTLIPPKATPKTGAASKVGLNSATLKGTVNPEGTTVTSCSFEYGTNFFGNEHSVPCKQTSGEIGNGDSPMPVSAEVTGLEASTTYNFDLVVTSAPGTAYGGIAAFTTLTPRHATPTTGTASDVGLNSATLEGTVNPEGTTATSCNFEYSTGATGFGYEHSVPCEQTSGEIGEGVSPVPVSAKVSSLEVDTTYHFRLVVVSVLTADGSNAQFTTLGPPVIESVSSSAIADTTAQLHATINPKATQTTYHFEYDTREYTLGEGSHGTSVPVPDAAVGEGTAGVAESVELTGLVAETTYYYRVVATNARDEVSYSGDYQLRTRPATPLIQQTLASPVGSTSANLTAYITPDYPQAPGHSQTTYHFEYGTSESYGSEAPSFDRDIGSGSEPVLVQEPISGLSPGVTYYFRVVAHNSTGTRYGPARTFTTLPASEASGSCPNEQVRKESDVNPETGVPFSVQLPECRAYEMVSPPSKNGAPVSSSAGAGISSASTVGKVGSEGSTVLIRSTGIWPGGEQAPNNDEVESVASEGVQYKVTRGAFGWKVKPDEPPALRTFVSALVPSSADMSAGGIWVGAGTEPAEAEIVYEFNPNFYLIEPDGSLAEIGPSVPSSDRSQHAVDDERLGGVASVLGASTDLSHLLFSLSDFRWPFDQTKTSSANPAIQSLYEYVGTGHSGEGDDFPTLVGVDDTGALISQCGTEAGGFEGEGMVRSKGSGEDEARSISADGSTVFFTTLAEGPKCEGGTGPAANQVFARAGEPGAGTVVGSAVTVNVAGTSATACEASDSCGVTKPVVYQGASTDGSEVFFTSEQPLAAGDTDSTSNLYECGGLPGDSGAPLAASSKGVNPCPDLVRVSVPVSGGAEVQSVFAISQDGSHVYFVAKGVLSGANAEHDSPTAGQDNLYVWTAGSNGSPGHTAFIATLPSAEFEPGQAQATPDGEQLVFTSSADLTADDTSTVSQVFLYEAQHEALIRVSKGQDGVNDDGNTTTDPASIPTETSTYNTELAEGRDAISEDGSTVVFQSSTALTPQVHGGTRNVYLWRGGNVYLISDGTPAGDATGVNGEGNAGLVGMDPSGQNVFFTTEAQLVGQDKDDLSDLYDARVDGGFPAPKVDECVGEACQGAPPAPVAALSPGSLSPGGAGNLTPLPAVKSTTRPKLLTRAQKLADALRACTKDKAKKKRAQCEAAARKRYGAKPRAKKRKAGKRKGKGAK